VSREEPLPLLREDGYQSALGFWQMDHLVSFDPATVRAFEHAGWQQVAPDYDATFARATKTFVAALLDGANVMPGARLLDLCSGTGVATAAAAERGAKATGLDFSAAMLAQARAAYPALRFDEGDAEALPYCAGGFDAVVANFGVHHVPQPALALGEVHRVLLPGSRFSFTAWANPNDNIAWRLLFDAIAAHGDPAAAKTPPSGGNLGSAESILRLLNDAGFSGTSAVLVRREWRLRGAEELIAALRRGTVRTAALIDAQPSLALPIIAQQLEHDMKPYRAGSGFAVPIAAILGTGTKPKPPR
jgi:ubiquinone/menaquinone biosynthesis C-methylase UbiE